MFFPGQKTEGNKQEQKKKENDSGLGYLFRF